MQKARAEADAAKASNLPPAKEVTPMLGTNGREKVMETTMDTATLDTKAPERATEVGAADIVSEEVDDDKPRSRKRIFTPGNRCCVIC